MGKRRDREVRQQAQGHTVSDGPELGFDPSPLAPNPTVEMARANEIGRRATSALYKLCDLVQVPDPP